MAPERACGCTGGQRPLRLVWLLVQAVTLLVAWLL
jgi:hypothetical protein